MPDPKAQADALRAEHGLGLAPIGDLQSFVDQKLGFDLALLRMPTGVDGVVMRDPSTSRVLIAICTSQNPERQRFSIAHEIGHVVLNDLAQQLEEHGGESSGAAEQRADTFARHFLIPRAAIDQYLARAPQVLTIEHLSELVQWFGVSPQVATIQLREGGRISNDVATVWMGLTAARLAAEFGWSSDRAARIAAAETEQIPQRIEANSLIAYRAGVIGVSTLARVRGTQVVDLQSELEELGLWIDEHVVSDIPDEPIDAI